MTADAFGTGAATKPVVVSSSFASGFAPGAILSGRYRIVALLGRGGMGEVYRADDLKLGHAVALKFLPMALARNRQALERFLTEVRNARQVSHPSVCRVHDVGEVEGQHFISMEFIDGEDLASLLRRIGRLPPDKALEIARQLCAGLAAAHERNVIHRDLKPANIMIDGRGKARITDFGLAVTSDESGAEFAGTPAYMAPEQLDGKPATQQSDIYALALVLYELFTGKRVFEGASIAELRRNHADGVGRLPSSMSADTDPAVERAILRCLAEDPRKRPANALQLAAALPGGNPLMAALAAGETPSPELIAAAGGEEAGISPKAAAALLVFIAVCLLALVPISRRASVFGLAPQVKAPDALADRAYEITKSLGYTQVPSESAGMMLGSLQMRYDSAREPSTKWYRELVTAEPGPHRFSYRQSPYDLIPPSPLGGVNAFYYPMDTPGMIAVGLDGHGHLLNFTAIPSGHESETQWSPVDWNRVLALTTVDLASLKPVTPTRVFSFAHDQRAEWVGTWPAGPAQVSAAAFRGRVVWLEVNGVWAQSGNAPRPDPRLGWVVMAFVFVVFGVVPVVAWLMARRNLRLGRGDRRGAFRLAAFVGVCLAISLLSVGGYHFTPYIVVQIAARLGIAVLSALVVWVCYLALEPLGRRNAPELLVSWVRMLDGRWNDPRVGRDVLLGLGVGTFLPVVAYTLVALPWWVDVRGVVPLQQIFAINDWAAVAMLLIGATPVFSLTVLFLLALLQGIFKRSWILLVAIFIIGFSGAITDNHLNLAFVLIYNSVSTILSFLLLTRVGPLSLAVGTMSCLLLWTNPLDFHGNNWYWPQSAAVMVFLFGLAVLGFRSALAGRPVIGPLLEE